MNTFIADSGGHKVDFRPGREDMKGLNSSYTAKYCTCTESTTNTSEIPDWDTAEELGILSDLKLAYRSARNDCDATTKAALQALEDVLKAILADMRE